MAKSKGILKFTGKLGDLSLYTLNGADVVRIAYGPDSKTIKNNPNYAAFRDQGTEFRDVSRSSKLIRDGFRTWLREIADPVLHSRMNKQLNLIKNLDAAEKGQRTVDRGIRQPGGRQLLNGFECNLHRLIDGGVKRAADAALASGVFQLNWRELQSAEPCHGLEIGLIRVYLDFRSNQLRTEDLVLLVITPEGSPVSVELPGGPETEGEVCLMVVRVRYKTGADFPYGRSGQSLTLV